MSEAAKRIELVQPDDWHVHLREGGLMRGVLGATSAVFRRAVVMPNLKSPVETVEQALRYKRSILESLPAGQHFEPLMTLYLTESTSPKDIFEATSAGLFGAKYYPKGATTLASKGIADPKSVFHVFEAMEEAQFPLLIHGEVADPTVDVFELEKRFIDEVLVAILNRFPRLKITLEHLSTEEAVRFVRANAPQLGATITVHHLLLNRNDLLMQPLNAHHYCMPIVKREEDRLALVEAATSGDACFFLGTDSAPHLTREKEQCGRPGIYTAPVALPLLADLFEQQNALSMLEAFCSLNGARHYGLPPNKTRIALVREAFWAEKKTPIHTEANNDYVLPFKAGEMIPWRIENIQADFNL